MTKQTTERKAFKCLRCGWQWFSRMKRPKVCPHCHSAYYDEPRGGSK